MTILVTGAAGFIGSHLCERLVGEGQTVIGIDNFDPFYPSAQKVQNLSGVRHRKGFLFCECDVRSTTQLKAIFQKHSIHVIVHLAGRGGVAQSTTRPFQYLAGC